MAKEFADEGLNERLLPVGEEPETRTDRRVGLNRACSTVGNLLLLLVTILGACSVFHHCIPVGLLRKHKHHHAHVSYQAVLKDNNQIEYSREFSVPCGYGILVFNIGPALGYEPFDYDVYQDAYVYSNNQKLWYVQECAAVLFKLNKKA